MNNIIKTGTMIVAAALAATSCSDFSDYNDTPVDINMSADKTLWENISQNKDLSDFAELVKKAGFDEALSLPHFYTVWAPMNGSFDKQTLLAEDNATLLKQFVKNHIADYNHVLSGAVDERVKVLNNKSYEFKGNGTYTFDGLPISLTNLPSSNGLVHVLNGAAQFYPNIYERISSITDMNVDSVANYFKRYEQVSLDTKNSVLGPTVNGKQTYIDSVMITENTAFEALYAKVDNEDSTYTMLVPTNEAWMAQYNKVKKYFNYIKTTMAQDMDEASSPTEDTKIPKATVTIDPIYNADSMTVQNIVGTLTYNNNNRYNNWLVEEGKQPYDTLRTTTRLELTNPSEIMSHTIANEKMSNGYFRIVDSLAFRPWETWCPTRVISPLMSRIWNGAAVLESISADQFDEIGYHPENPSSSSLINYWVSALSGFGKPEIDIKLHNVLSTTYNIYVVLAPSTDLGTDAEGNWFRKPNQLDFSISYCDAKGKLLIQKLNQKVENNPNKVDTLSVGTFTFPVSYFGLGEKIYPNLKITTDFGVFDTTKMATYTRDLRIVSVLLKPVEQEQFEAQATKEN